MTQTDPIQDALGKLDEARKVAADVLKHTDDPDFMRRVREEAAPAIREATAAIADAVLGKREPEPTPEPVSIEVPWTLVARLVQRRDRQKRLRTAGRAEQDGCQALVDSALDELQEFVEEEHGRGLGGDKL